MINKKITQNLAKYVNRYNYIHTPIYLILTKFFYENIIHTIIPYVYNIFMGMYTFVVKHIIYF